MGSGGYHAFDPARAGEAGRGIAAVMEESTEGIVSAAGHTGELARNIALIREEAENNGEISDHLRDEVQRFKKL